MEHTLIVITIAFVVLLVVFMVSVARYYRKHTLLSLILYLVSSTGIAALEIVVILMGIYPGPRYIPAFNACISAVNALFAAFHMVDRFCGKKNVEIIDANKSNDNEDE